MAIRYITINVYNDQQMSDLVVSEQVNEPTRQADVCGLGAGKQYFCSEIIEDTDGQTSEEFGPYKFFTLPQINLEGNFSYEDTHFSHPTQITTDVVGIKKYGLEYDTVNTFTNPKKVEGNTVENVEEHTTYYVRPWLIDEYDRTWINTADVETITTEFSVPIVDFDLIYGATVGTFSCSINITSLAPLSDVHAEYTTSGITRSLNLLAQTGTQLVELTGLTPNTNYELIIKATNSTGTGESTIYNFTTLSEFNLMEVEILQGSDFVNNRNNDISCTSNATYDENCTLLTHDIILYDNIDHIGQAIETYNGGQNDTITGRLENADAGVLYYLFGYTTYTVGNDPTVQEQWSEPVQINTYTLLEFDNITPATNTAEINYIVHGNSQNTEIEYSIDQITWETAQVPDPQGGTITIGPLQPDTTYYLRGRCLSDAGWQEYITDTFRTNL